MRSWTLHRAAAAVKFLTSADRRSGSSKLETGRLVWLELKLRKGAITLRGRMQVGIIVTIAWRSFNLFPYSTRSACAHIVLRFLTPVKERRQLFLHLA